MYSCDFNKLFSMEPRQGLPRAGEGVRPGPGPVGTAGSGGGVAGAVGPRPTPVQGHGRGPGAGAGAGAVRRRPRRPRWLQPARAEPAPGLPAQLRPLPCSG